MRLLSLFSILQLQLSLLSQSHVSAATVGSLPVKTVVEYPLPAAAQTHEILAVSDDLLLISQQTDGSLVKVALDNNGQPTGARKWTATNQWSGLHGLALHSGSGSNSSVPTVWATVQFDNAILQIDPKGDDINSQPQVINTIPIPSPAFGPHGVLENNGNLWISCKDSSHVVRININNPADHQVWAVSGRPIFVAVHPTSGDVFASLDLSSKIWHYKNDGGNGEEIAVPPEKGSTPVGLIAGADANVWVVLLGNETTGTGTFGRINKDASIDWFTMSSDIGSTAPLIHLAFDQDPTRFWLLGSSTACPSCVNAVFTVKIDDISTGGTANPRIAIQNTIVLPTQRSWTHRMISHGGSLYITELTTSTLAHVSGAAVNGLNVSETWDQYSDYGLGLKAQVIDYNNTIY
jgi:virginiamycin B lyase